MPVLPFVVEDYGAPEWVYGLLLTSYSAFQFLGAPYLGALSDDIGRKPVLLISQLGTLLSWGIFYVALQLPNTHMLGLSIPLAIIAISRITDGITGGNTSVTNAYVADITTRQEKSYIFGYLGGIAGLGMIIGPGLGGLTASGSLGYSGTLITAMIISVLALLSIILWLKETHQPKEKSARTRQNLMSSLLIARRIRHIQPAPLIKLLFGMKLFFAIMMAFYISTIALFIIARFEFNERELGIFMLVVGIFLSFNQAFMSKIFIRKLGEFKTLILGLSLCVVGLFAITLSHNLWAYIGFYYVMNLGLSLCFPTFNSLIAIHANPEKQGEIMGVSESINSLAMAVIPVIGAGLYGMFGYPLYYFIAFLPLVALLLAIRFRSLGNPA